MQVNRRREPAHGPGWQQFGACRDEDPELFFPTGVGRAALAQAARAIAVCGRCPVTGACLSWALATREQHGVWGGLTEQDRRAVMRSRAVLSSRAQLSDPAAGHSGGGRPLAGDPGGAGRVA